MLDGVHARSQCLGDAFLALRVGCDEYPGAVRLLADGGHLFLGELWPPRLPECPRIRHSTGGRDLDGGCTVAQVAVNVAATLPRGVIDHSDLRLAVASGRREQRPRREDARSDVLPCLNRFRGLDHLVARVSQAAQSGHPGMQLGKKVGLRALSQQRPARRRAQELGGEGSPSVGRERLRQRLAVGKRCACALINPGSAYLPLRSIRWAPGTVGAFAAGPAYSMVPRLPTTTACSRRIVPFASPVTLEQLWRMKGECGVFMASVEGSVRRARPNSFT